MRMSNLYREMVVFPTPSLLPGAPFTNMVQFSAWIGDCIHYNVSDEITYQFPYFNGATIEIW